MVISTVLGYSKDGKKEWTPTRRLWCVLTTNALLAYDALHSKSPRYVFHIVPGTRREVLDVKQLRTQCTTVNELAVNMEGETHYVDDDILYLRL